ncbi:MAG: hypothetical protein HY343_00475, partial [Lentisphaerae bacterium]|nr:hypothetical protein [Lentisphaerota bacterium]
MTPRFAFGCAAGLYRRGVHPRVLVGPADLPRLRRTMRQGTCRKVMDAMRSQLRPLVEQMLAGHDLKDLLAHRQLRQGRGDSPVLQRLHDLALVGVLDADAGTLEAVRRALVGLPGAEDLSTGFWCSPRYHHVGTIAYAYDLVQASLSDADRRTFLRWALDCSLRLSLKLIRETHYLRTAGMNVPVVGMITALTTLLAIEGDPGVPDLTRERAELLSYFEATLHTALGPAGYPLEDTGYGTAVVPYLMPLMDAVRRAGLYDATASCPRVRRFGEALLHLVQPWGDVLSNTGDNTPDVLWREWALARLA